MIACESTSTPTVRFVISILRPGTDKLLLVRCVPKDESVAAGDRHRRILDQLTAVAAEAGVKAEQVVLPGKTELLPDSARLHRVDVFCVQAPKVKILSEGVKAILKTVPCTLLLYKHENAVSGARKAAGGEGADAGPAAAS